MRLGVGNEMRAYPVVPLPLWGDLARIPFQGRWSEKERVECAMPWIAEGESEQGFWFARSSWALWAIVKEYQRRTQKTKVRIAFPDFYCNSALQILRANHCEFHFYPIKESLDFDFSKVMDFIGKNQVNLFVFVHYFAKEIALSEGFISFCVKNAIWLIEDAAHVAVPSGNIGKQGDMVIYSPYKHFALPEAGLLVARRGPNHLNFVLRESKEVFLPSNDSLSSKFPAFCSILWLFKRSLQKLGVRKKQRVQFQGEDGISFPILHSHLCALSQKLLFLLKPQIGSIIERKCEARKLISVFINEFIAPCFDKDLVFCEVEGVSHLARVDCNMEEKAEKWFYRFWQCGLPVFSWPDLPPEISDTERVENNVARKLRKTSVYFPIQHTLNVAAIYAGAKSVYNSFCKEYFIRSVEKKEWFFLYSRVEDANLLQSWEYGDAKQSEEGWEVLRYVVCNAMGDEVAILQVLKKSLPLVGCVLRCNRGPLLLRDETRTKQSNFYTKLVSFDLLETEARKMRCRYMRVAPELLDSEASHFLMKTLGFRQRKESPWASVKVDLEGDDAAILAGFNGKWRNCFRKGEKMGIRVVEAENSREDFFKLTTEYRKLQQDCDFEGISEGILRKLFFSASSSVFLRLFWAYSPDESDQNPIGGVVVCVSGDTAMYLIGFSNDTGKKMQANSVLLWYAICYAKRSGCKRFDLGGLNETTPLGVAQFKKGLNGVPYRLVGEWNKILS